ncbi:phosphoenolpyruvate carboxykinase (ATP) [Sulfoacidibacillus thermotolerans]|uniref:Phosphoenolpyruvate carboxykinase (ATP) n=1 Tax=Sulfoacidibacillus thermotolerans TaxID=1765684 RepID=A0A2U3D9F2_SULT2|nr:phosphoenolpyruvate carboxykinase (ATP) [Sulfoacidibacillus thermotolerans]PWI57893.1 phosphoenolpyruvate carboxykinase (ATP) [Sulfoacidibacillus thermotolerans]
MNSLLNDRLESTLRNAHTYYNLSTPELIELALARKEGILTDTGALRATTGKFTGRSPKDKFFVVDEETKDRIHWGSVNQKIDESAFLRLYHEMLEYISQHDAFVFDGFAGASAEARLPIRVVTEYAWHSLFSRQLFIRPSQEELAMHTPAFTLIDLPSVKANPAIDHTNSDTFIIVSFKHRTVLIGGSGYAGEIKKSIFTILNFLLPQKGILPMHCSANKAQESDHVALFFGLSGTGKTTLSADPHRELIGDDEHGWSDEGVFNFEGGCYAKCIGLTEAAEPQIWNAIRFGTVLENVVVQEQTRTADYASAELTENTRAAYPVEFIPNARIPSIAGHPSVIVFLTADASGVLPPISRLTKEQAMYHFLSGYTSKLAGTERGVTQPEATFSSCFGAPFLPLHPMEYANMLGQKIDEHQTSVFLVNTGWSGGPYGVGKRMKLEYTRKMVQAALSGQLDQVNCVIEPYFGLAIPTQIAGVPSEVLQPELTWENKEDYRQAAQALAARFKENFKKFSDVPSEILSAGPRA